ncbi:MAG: hypothetical protein SFX19_00230 [Alphaproteobacteria bacterium]|nr:hypothetical protein [Alphaproteobacteria bacterium]
MSFFLTRKAKKKAQAKKNKYHQMIFEMVRLRREEDGRLKEEEEKRRKTNRLSEAKKEDDLVWSAKVGEVRNRLTDKKRASKERWNRFAGTEGGGGRGL